MDNGDRGRDLLAERYKLGLKFHDCADCDCSSSAVLMAGGCPRRQDLEPDRSADQMGDDDLDDMSVLTGGEWAFIWAIVVVGLIALLALAGYVWRRWLHAMAVGWLS